MPIAARKPDRAGSSDRGKWTVGGSTACLVLSWATQAEGKRIVKKGFHLASRMTAIQPFYVMELLGRARELESQGRSIVHMEVGEPDFPAADSLIEAARALLEHGRIGYTPALGLPELRIAIAAYYLEYYGVEVPAERIVVTPGASGALLAAMTVLVDPGDQILMTDPGYPCNRHFVRLMGGEPVAIPVTAHSGYQLTAEQVARSWGPRTRGVMVASPANPTGTILPERMLRDIFGVADARGGVLLVDEIYHGLTYGRRCSTALALSDDVFVINSFSKYFGMTGWRVGWLVAPLRCIGAVERIMQNVFLAASTVAQHAALAALAPQTRPVFEARRVEFQARRDLLVPALRDMGFGVPVFPEGAFYVYADSSRFAADSHELAMRLLEEVGVAVTPGRDFGVNAPERHLRFAYTTGQDQLREGITRLRSFLAAE
jgi:aspartate/methionine/tyrosine aminotransferase